jgi:hypothetical protein
VQKRHTHPTVQAVAVSKTIKRLQLFSNGLGQASLHRKALASIVSDASDQAFVIDASMK